MSSSISRQPNSKQQSSHSFYTQTEHEYTGLTQAEHEYTCLTQAEHEYTDVIGPKQQLNELIAEMQWEKYYQTEPAQKPLVRAAQASERSIEIVPEVFISQSQYEGIQSEESQDQFSQQAILNSIQHQHQPNSFHHQNEQQSISYKPQPLSQNSQPIYNQPGIYYFLAVQKASEEDSLSVVIPFQSIAIRINPQQQAPAAKYKKIPSKRQSKKNFSKRQQYYLEFFYSKHWQFSSDQPNYLSRLKLLKNSTQIFCRSLHFISLTIENQQIFKLIPSFHFVSLKIIELSHFYFLQSIQFIVYLQAPQLLKVSVSNSRLPSIKSLAKAKFDCLNQLCLISNFINDFSPVCRMSFSKVDHLDVKILQSTRPFLCSVDDMRCLVKLPSTEIDQNLWRRLRDSIIKKRKQEIWDEQAESQFAITSIKPGLKLAKSLMKRFMKVYNEGDFRLLSWEYMIG